MFFSVFWLTKTPIDTVLRCVAREHSGAAMREPTFLEVLAENRLELSLLAIVVVLVFVVLAVLP